MRIHRKTYPSQLRQDPEVVRKARERIRSHLRERESHSGRGLFWVAYLLIVAYLGSHLIAWVMR